MSKGKGKSASSSNQDTARCSRQPDKTKSITPKARRPKVFRDAVHDLISLGSDDAFILDLIDAKEFQRLRRIRQLGLAHYVYPCAEHSRFVHSLGVFNFARRIIRQLLIRHEDDEKIKGALLQHRRTIKAAALLHDLGHGPFSHVFEHVFPGSGAVKHETWTCRIIRDEQTMVNQRLKNAGIDVNAVCALVWDGAPQAFEDVEQVAEPFVKDIVSSQLDADRMDYLLRDSLMTGSQYGRYDCEWIVNALAIGQVSFLGTELKLCLDASKGTGAINGFLIARSLMTQHVYGHKTTRAYESELLNTLRIAGEIAEELPRETPPAVREFLVRKGDVSVKNYLLLDDEVAWWSLRQWAVWRGSLPRKGRSRMLAEALKLHALRLVRRGVPWIARDLKRTDFARINAVKEKIDQSGGVSPFDYFVDDGRFLPYKDLEFSQSQGLDDEQAFFDEVFLLDKYGQGVRLSDYPGEHLVAALRKPATTCRLYYDRKVSREFARLLGELGVSLG